MRERSERVESPGTNVTEPSFTRPFLFGPVSLRIALPCSGGYHLERGWLPSHDAVVINCKKGATTKNQGAGVKYMAKGCMFDDCVCII